MGDTCRSPLEIGATMWGCTTWFCHLHPHQLTKKNKKLFEVRVLTLTVAARLPEQRRL